MWRHTRIVLAAVAAIAMLAVVVVLVALKSNSPAPVEPSEADSSEVNAFGLQLSLTSDWFVFIEGTTSVDIMYGTEDACPGQRSCPTVMIYDLSNPEVQQGEIDVLQESVEGCTASRAYQAPDLVGEVSVGDAVAEFYKSGDCPAVAPDNYIKWTWVIEERVLIEALSSPSGDFPEAAFEQLIEDATTSW